MILRKLSATDPEGKRHIIRMLSHFEFRGHLCLVFEPMVRCCFAPLPGKNLDFKSSSESPHMLTVSTAGCAGVAAARCACPGACLHHDYAPGRTLRSM